MDRERIGDIKVMRKTFVQVLQEGKIDIRKEYDKLFSLLHQRVFYRNTKSLYNIMDSNFISFPFRGTCLSIEEFNRQKGICFVNDPQEFNIDYLISFCEYLYNMLFAFEEEGDEDDVDEVNLDFLFKQIRAVIESIGYTSINEGRFTIFVEKSPAAIAVSESEMIPNDLSYRVLQYNHHALKGDIAGKKQIILQLAQILEAKSKDLQGINSTLKDDLFFLFNNLNLRHNNIDPSNNGKYKKYVAEVSSEDLERYYDETYQMCLLAFLELEHAKRKPLFDALKKKIIAE